MARIPSQPDLFSPRESRDLAMARIEAKANRDEPFSDQAMAFVVSYLQRHGPTSGEHITDACKKAGIRPHDDRAFGAVYMSLARQRIIHKVGTCVRTKGHLTAGGNVWDLT